MEPNDGKPRRVPFPVLQTRCSLVQRGILDTHVSDSAQLVLAEKRLFFLPGSSQPESGFGLSQNALEGFCREREPTVTQTSQVWEAHEEIFRAIF